MRDADGPTLSDHEVVAGYSTARSEQGDDELEAALAARDEFIVVLGHELRNSVAPLVLLAEQFERPLDASGPQLAARARLLTKHLRRLGVTVERVAELGQLREGRVALDLTFVDLGELATHVVNLMQREALAGGLELRIAATPGVIAKADRARVKQILLALLSNAIRYSGGGVVDVIVRDAGDAELIVQDHGRGIAERERDHLFDRFDRKGPRGAGGLGVGLWVVKALCHAMGGEVKLEPVDGPGARFCVTLPHG
jgi:signal transduction histidine kinase